METKVPLHIFIVENCRLFVKLIDYIFSKNISFRFLDFQCGEDCLKNLHINPDLIILDYSLPGMNGYETLLEIKEQLPAAYVIILLSEEDKKLPAEFLNAGATDYVIKDGSEEKKVIDKIEDFIKNKEEEQQKRKSRRPWLKRKLYLALLILIILSISAYYY